MSWIDVIAVAVGIALSWAITRRIEPIHLEQANQPNVEAPLRRLRLLYHLALMIMRLLAK